LNLIAGLLLPTSGSIVCEQKPIRGPGPDRAMVFQSHALLPWMTCYQNVELAVRQVFGRTHTPAELKHKVEQALTLVHLEHAMHKYPFEISGGMKQRVGIARALAVAPRVLLLDEPFGALDALTRASLQDELVRIVESIHATVDRVLMMTNGPAARIGDVLEVALPRPRNRLELATNPQYSAYRQYLLKFLYQKQGVSLE
jgi:nitrate/nitrite transport system ATP-binding protein